MGVRSADGPRTRLAVPRPRSNRLSFAFRPRIRAVNEMLARRGVSDRDGNAPTSRRSASSSPRAADEDQDHARFRLRRAAPAVERGGITHAKSSRCARRSPRRCDARVIAVREYRLIVEGELSDELSPFFKGMALTREGGNTGSSSSWWRLPPAGPGRSYEARVRRSSESRARRSSSPGPPPRTGMTPGRRPTPRRATGSSSSSERACCLRAERS
jgi:hypothetical protein